MNCLKSKHNSRQECPLCGGQAHWVDHSEHRQGQGRWPRDFYKCSQCWLVFVPLTQHLDETAANERYATHLNDSKDLGYRRFLNRLWHPLRLRLRPDDRGLDYGCGPPSPRDESLTALVKWVREEGFDIQGYDPVFFPERPTGSYDFIVCTEVVEHFTQPRVSWGDLLQFLKPGGQLGIMTQLWEETTQFQTWHYAKDPTHVSFYHRRTMEFIAKLYDLKAQAPTEGVMIFEGSSLREP